MNRTIALIVGIVAVVGFAVGGFLIGKAAAPDQQDARQARSKARVLAATSAARRASQEAEEKGQQEGFRAGRMRGERLGRANGGAAGEAAAAEQLAAIEQEQAAELTYTPALPNGDPGYVLPEEERTLGCVGYSAVDGECVGD